MVYCDSNETNEQCNSAMGNKQPANEILINGKLIKYDITIIKLVSL